MGNNNGDLQASEEAFDELDLGGLFDDAVDAQDNPLFGMLNAMTQTHKTRMETALGLTQLVAASTKNLDEQAIYDTFERATGIVDELSPMQNLMSDAYLAALEE